MGDADDANSSKTAEFELGQTKVILRTPLLLCTSSAPGATHSVLLDTKGEDSAEVDRPNHNQRFVASLVAVLDRLGDQATNVLQFLPLGVGSCTRFRNITSFAGGNPFCDERLCWSKPSIRFSMFVCEP